jgi:predicted dehydrogenase
MTKRKIKLGFIGCGGFASSNHIPNAAANPNFELGAFCDLDGNKLRELKEKYSPDYVTADIEDVFADPQIEAIICSTKPDFRLPVMRRAVESGKHLFVEKPLCYKEDEVEEMVSLMNRSKIKFMVGFNRPYSPLMQNIKPLLKKYRKGNTTIVYRIVGEARLWPQHHYDAVIKRKESTIIHEVTHIFNLLNWLTDLTPFRVYTAGAGNVDNIITLNYPEDITAVIIAGDNSLTGFPKERIEINTNFSTIIGDEFIELNVYGNDGERIKHNYDYRMEGKTYNTSIAEATELGWKWRQSVTEEEKEKGYYYARQVKVDKGHYNELEMFRQWIIEDKPSQTDVVQGAIASLIAWQAIESWEKKTPIELDFSYLDTLDRK